MERIPLTYMEVEKRRCANTTVQVMEKFPVSSRSVPLAFFLFRFLSFPFSELRITSALAFKVLSRASDRSRRCSLTPRSKGSWLCVARHDENRCQSIANRALT